MNITILLAIIGVGVLIFFGIAALLARFYAKVEQGKALIVNKMKAEPEVTFTGMIVLPVLHKAEVMDISVKTIEIDRRGKEGLICKDNIRADIKVIFFVRVNKTHDDVIKVAQAIGCNRASDRGTLEELFNAKFSEALKTVGKKLDFVDLYTQRNVFRDEIINVIGKDLNGYALEDAAIDFLEQTPITSLDERNILDAQGIRKITELTAVEHIRTNQYTNNAKKHVKKEDVEAAEAILELERQLADATARQKREIDSVVARETAETLKVQEEERLKSETTRIRVGEEIAIQQENCKRQIEVAQKNRERIVSIEHEKVERERQLEVISREREVELQRISKERDIEAQRKIISEVIRERISVDKTVAQQEEQIKDLRMLEEAKRLRESALIAAEGEAQEKFLREVKAAEASETSAKFKANEQLIIANTELEAADRHARAKIRLAEGAQAEAAADGLAKIKVKEADVQASERYGLSQAKIKEANAQAAEKEGMAQASVLRERGIAEAQTVRERLLAEANGLAQKAEAMKALDEVSRLHEEFRMRLENDRTLALKALESQATIAQAQSQMLGSALQNTKIDIIGGDNLISGRILESIGLGKTIDGFVNSSDTARKLINGVQSWLGGQQNGSKDLPNATVGEVLRHLLNNGGNEEEKEKLRQLLDTAEKIGADKVEF